MLYVVCVCVFVCVFCVYCIYIARKRLAALVINFNTNLKDQLLIWLCIKINCTLISIPLVLLLGALPSTA